MSGNFLTKSRHGTVYYFRRRVPESARHVICRQFLVKSLGTSDRREAVVRVRVLAVQTDAIFQRIAMTTKPDDSDSNDGSTWNFEIFAEYFESGLPSSIRVKAEPEEQEAVDSAIRELRGAQVRLPSSPRNKGHRSP